MRVALPERREKLLKLHALRHHGEDEGLEQVVARRVAHAAGAAARREADGLGVGRVDDGDVLPVALHRRVAELLERGRGVGGEGGRLGPHLPPPDGAVDGLRELGAPLLVVADAQASAMRRASPAP